MDSVKESVIDMRNNPYIREKELGDNISSFNFTRKAFYDGHWNEQTITARGLFVDTTQNKVICRGYPKFFRYEEQGIDKEFLKEKITFPVKVFQKENGFLGLFTSRNHKPIFATKSQTEGPYNNYFSECMRKSVSNAVIQKMADYCEKNDCTLLFEVIDMVNDPHIIEYEKSYNVVLLDAVQNDMSFSKISYSELKKLGKEFSVKVKTLSKILYNFDELFSFIDRNMEEQPFVYYLDFDSNNKIEGYVIEDKNGYMFKLKTQYYSFWKFMRSVSGSTVKYGEYKHKGRFVGNEAAEKFYLWLLLHKNDKEIVEMVSKNQIIEIRKAFVNSV